MLEVDELPKADPSDPRTVIRARGRLDASTSSVLEKALSHAHTPTIVIDMSELTYISSSGLRVLLTARRKAREQNGDVVLCALTPNVRDVFNMVGFTALFTIKSSVE